MTDKTGIMARMKKLRVVTIGDTAHVSAVSAEDTYNMAADMQDEIDALRAERDHRTRQAAEYIEKSLALEEIIKHLRAELAVAAKKYEMEVMRSEKHAAELRAELAASQAAQAAQWEPVPNSFEYDLITYIIRHGDLPDNVRLCRKGEEL